MMTISYSKLVLSKQETEVLASSPIVLSHYWNIYINIMLKLVHKVIQISFSSKFDSLNRIKYALEFVSLELMVANV